MRRAAVSSAIATGALVALAAPSWASTSNAPDGIDTISASVASADIHQQSGSGSTAGSPTDSVEDSGNGASSRPDAGPLGGVVHGLAGLVGATGSHSYVVAPSSQEPATLGDPVVPTTSTQPPTSTPPEASVAPVVSAAPKASAASSALTADPAATTGVTQPPAPDTSSVSSTREATTAAQAHHVAPMSEPTTSTENAAPADGPVSSDDASMTTTPAAAPGMTETATPDAADGSVIPIAALTGSVASVLENAPAQVTSTVDRTVGGVKALTTPLDRVAGGSVSTLVGSTLDTTAHVLDGVVASVGQTVVVPTAQVVRSAGETTQGATDGALGVVGAMLPALGGVLHPGSDSSPTAPQGGTQMGDGDDGQGDEQGAAGDLGELGDGATGTDTVGQLPGTFDTIAPTLGGGSAPAYVGMLLGSLAGHGQAGGSTPGAAAAATAAAEDLTSASQAGGATTRIGGGADLRVPVDGDQMPTNGGSGQSHSGPNQVGSDLTSPWLPGAARLAVPTAEAWRLPGSVSFEPGHSPD